MRPGECSPPAGLEVRCHMLGVRVINPAQLHSPLAGLGIRLQCHSQARVPRFVFIKMITLKQGVEDGAQHQARCRLGQLTPAMSRTERRTPSLPAPRKGSLPTPRTGEQAPQRALGCPEVSKLFSWVL